MILLVLVRSQLDAPALQHPQGMWLNLVHTPIPWPVRVQTLSFHLDRFPPVTFPATSFLLGWDVLLGINP